MHHESLPEAVPGDNVGFNIRLSPSVSSRPPLPRRWLARLPRPPRRPTRRSEPMLACAGLVLVVGTWSSATCTSLGKSSAGYPALPVRCLLLSILVQTWHSVSCLGKNMVGSTMALLDNLCLTLPGAF